jgi:ribosomal protein S27AE
MTVQQHRWIQWLLPIGTIVLSFPLAIAAARAFPEAKSAGNCVVFGGILLAMLLSVGHQFLPVQCPACGTRLSFYPATHSKIPRYTCGRCGYQGR